MTGGVSMITQSKFAESSSRIAAIRSDVSLSIGSGSEHPAGSTDNLGDIIVRLRIV